MFYRFVCSLKDLKNIIHHINKKKIFISMDLFEIDDFICIKFKHKIVSFCIIKQKLVFDLTSNVIQNKSYVGYVVELEQYSSSFIREIKERYTQGGYSMAEIKLEEVQEEQQMYSDDALYNINSWGADLSFREIINMYDDDELLKPELQRKYVWTKTEASRFIDSILLGLPVPSVFFAKEPNETMLIIDGFQRLMTVYDYVKGIFSGDGKVFKLSNTENINERWRGKAFSELELEEKRRIRGTTIHVIIFEQKYPKNDTGMFQIFERINTGGRTLKAQEIRNCVYQGQCNDLLVRLNKLPEWREILGSDDEDARMADLELILRFFAMSELNRRDESKLKQINLAKYLNQFMNDKTFDRTADILEMENRFISMVKACRAAYGKDAFKNVKNNSTEFTSKINPAIFDAIAVATSYALEKKKFDENNNYKQKYVDLLRNEEFCNAASKRTTNVQNIIKRISLATEKIYGVKYEG